MNLRKHLTIAAAATALLAGTALPASADDTATTFRIEAGTLNLTVAASASLGVSYATGSTEIFGTLGLVTVDDNRGGTAAWSATAASTVFTGALASPSTSALVEYTRGSVDVASSEGSVTVDASSEKVLPLVETLPAAVNVLQTSAVSGNNIATWTPRLDVTMLASAKADDYSGTVTTSIS